MVNMVCEFAIYLSYITQVHFNSISTRHVGFFFFFSFLLVQLLLDLHFLTVLVGSISKNINEPVA